MLGSARAWARLVTILRPFMGTARAVWAAVQTMHNVNGFNR